MKTWPVSKHIKSYFMEFFDSHDISLLPAFDANNKLIPPAKYDSMLYGAIAKFSSHTYIFSLRKLETSLPICFMQTIFYPTGPHKYI